MIKFPYLKTMKEKFIGFSKTNNNNLDLNIEKENVLSFEKNFLPFEHEKSKLNFKTCSISNISKEPKNKDFKSSFKFCVLIQGNPLEGTKKNTQEKWVLDFANENYFNHIKNIYDYLTIPPTQRNKKAIVGNQPKESNKQLNDPLNPNKGSLIQNNPVENINPGPNPQNLNLVNNSKNIGLVGNVKLNNKNVPIEENNNSKNYPLDENNRINVNNISNNNSLILNTKNDGKKNSENLDIAEKILIQELYFQNLFRTLNYVNVHNNHINNFKFDNKYNFNDDQEFSKKYYEYKKIEEEKLEKNQNKTKILTLEIEWLIFETYSLFKNFCMNISKKLVEEFPVDQFNSNSISKISPFLIPSYEKIKSSKYAAYLYNLNKINVHFTLTWNKILLKNEKKNDKNNKQDENKKKIEDLLTYEGKWKFLRKEFKNRDLFIDLISLFSSKGLKVEKFPCIPMTCIIDYHGFRIYCESSVPKNENNKSFRKNTENLKNQNEKNNYEEYYKLCEDFSGDFYDFNSIGKNNELKEEYEENLISEENIVKKNPISDNKLTENIFMVKTKNYSSFYNIQSNTNKSKEKDPLIIINDRFKNLTNNIFVNIKDKLYENLPLLIEDDELNLDFFKDKDLLSIKENDSQGDIENNQEKNNLNNENNSKPQKVSINALNLNNLSQNLNEEKYEDENDYNNEIDNDFENDFKSYYFLDTILDSKDKFLKIFQTYTKFTNINNLDKIENNSPALSEDFYIYPMKYNFLMSITQDDKKEINKNPNHFYRPEYLFYYFKNNSEMNNNTNKSITEEEKNNKKKLNENFNFFLKEILMHKNSDSKSKNFNEFKSYFFIKHIYYFTKSLDNLCYIPLDSEHLTEIFHSNGINMFYLGKVAEQTTVPHVRELCIIEMISRICKRLIHQILSNKKILQMEKLLLNLSFEIVNNKKENLKPKERENEINPEIGINNNNQGHLELVSPNSFFKFGVKYADYFDALNTNYSQKPTKKFDIDPKNIKNYISDPFLSSEKENENYIKLKNHNNSNQNFSDELKEFVKFMNILFNPNNSFNNNKNNFYNEIEISEEKYNHSKLWNKIIEEIKKKFCLENDYVIEMIKNQYFSLLALFHSILFHSGIKFIGEAKNICEDLYSYSGFKTEFKESIFEIQTKIKGFKFRNFISNKMISTTTMNIFNESFFIDNFSSRIPVKNMLFRNLIEHFMYNCSEYTEYSLIYLDALNKISEKSFKFDLFEGIVLNWLKKYEKERYSSGNFISNKNYESKLIYELKYIFYKFSSVILNFYFYIQEIKIFSNSLNANITNLSNKLEFRENDLFKNYKNKIKNFFYENYYFQGIAELIFGRIFYKKIDFRKTDNNLLINRCINHFMNSLRIFNNSLGSNNIFTANLNLEIGKLYSLLNNEHLKAISYYTNSYKIFSDYKEEFWEIYKIILVDLCRLNSQMGFSQIAFKYALEYLSEYEKNEKFETKKIPFEYKEVLFNCLIMTESLNKTSEGLEICRKIFDKKIFDKKNFLQKENFENYLKNKIEEEINKKQFFTKYLKYIIKDLSDDKLRIYYEWLYSFKNTFEENEEKSNLKIEEQINKILMDAESSEFKDFGDYFLNLIVSFVNSNNGESIKLEKDEKIKSNEQTLKLKWIYLIFKDEVFN